MFPPQPTPNELQKARDCYLIFFNRSQNYSGDMRRFNLASWYQYVENETKGITSYYLGKSLLETGYSMSRVRSVLENLADEYEGRVPDRDGLAGFLTAIADDSYSISYKTDLIWEGVKQGAVSTVQTIGSIAKWGVGIYAVAGLVFLYLAVGRKR